MGPQRQMMDVVVRSTGRYVPERVFLNHEFESFLDTSDQWITERTGIKERHLAAPGESVSDMSLHAARQALERAGLGPEDIDLIVVATVTGDTVFPSTANWLQGKLGNTRGWSFDINAACSGFIYSLSTVTALLRSGQARRALLVGAEKMSAILDFTDRASCVLFGDAAAALVLEAVEPEQNGEGYGIGEFYLGSDGSLAEILYQPCGGSSSPPTFSSVQRHGHYVKMQGQDVYKNAVRRMDEVVDGVLKKQGVAPESVDWFIAHQANVRIIDSVRERMKLPAERFYVNIQRYGNTTSATIPLCLDELVCDGRLSAGQNLVLFTFGAGLTWGSAFLKWGVPAGLAPAPGDIAKRDISDNEEAAAGAPAAPVEVQR
ncbi:ketoacyl-ACP synthase III [bacterium]|nr:ketoacyl-ACP synthase III [bacterium]